MHGQTRWLLPLCSVSLYIFLYVPLLLVVLFSLTPAEYSFRWEGVTLRWYREVWQNTHILQALQISLLVTTATVLIATTIGTLTALTLYRAHFRGKMLLHALLYIPFIMPSLVIGIALLLLFVALRIELGILTIVLAHVAFSIPLTTLVLLARMQRLEPVLEEAAMDLGADEWTTFRRVTLPLLKPGILAAALLTVPWSLNDFVVTFFVAGVGASTLPLRIYAMLRVGVSPMVNALGTLLVVVPIMIALLAMRYARRQL